MRDFHETEDLLLIAYFSRFNGGDVAFIIAAGAMVFFMVPGLGACSYNENFAYICSLLIAFLYSGLSRRKSACTLSFDANHRCGSLM